MQASIIRNGQATQEAFDTDFLGDTVRVRLLRHAVRMYHANKRQGTHSTKRRADLHFRRKALFKQKGTGRARVRHASATQCRHGAVPKGPQPRDYSYQMPRRAKFEALRSALLSKFRDAEIGVIDTLAMEAPKTAQLRGLLDQFGYEKSCLIVTHERDENLLLSARNLRRVSVLPVQDLNAWDVLQHRNVVITENALSQFRERVNEA